MTLWQRLRAGFGARPVRTAPKTEGAQGVLVFAGTAEVIRAERILERAGIAAEVKGPPPDLRTGCDMVLVFPLLLEPAALAALESENLHPLRVLPLGDMLEPVSLFQTARSGSFVMVRAANMKITVDAGGRIVNISGGGCPDVPYLASLLIGADVREAAPPREHGKTLCSYALQKAFEEVRRLADVPRAPLETDGGDPFAVALPDETPLAPAEPAGHNAPRPWLVCGTSPFPDFPLTLGRWTWRNGLLVGEGLPPLPVQRGTPALLAAMALTCEALGAPGPEALLVGDDGRGIGSDALYRHLAGTLLPECRWQGLTFHYLFPDLDGHNRVLAALPEDSGASGGVGRPLLVADAGYMYVAKMSGYAAQYDLFTPDAGELAFLADEKAPHPFYTRGFLLAEDNAVPELAARAETHHAAARHLLVKGATDYLIRGGVVEASVASPRIPAMEAIGGTGDLVTGMASGFLAAGFGMADACLCAARANRLIGLAARPDPATQVGDLLPHVPLAVRRASGWS